MLPSSLQEVQSTVSGVLLDLLGDAYRKIGRQVVSTGPALFTRAAYQSIADVTVSGLAVVIDRGASFDVIDLHDQAAIAPEWKLYLLQYRGSDHLDEATVRLLRAFPLARAVPLGGADDDGSILSQTTLTIQGAMS